MEGTRSTMDSSSTSNTEEKRRCQTPPRRSGRPPMSPMVRGVVDHPLSRKNVETPSGSIQTPVSSAYTASLVQSAAKSLLDTPSSTVSDEESSVEAPSSPGLQSLLTKTLPALPDKQDRKRFIGCLAAVLASTYDYDSDNGDETVTSISDSFAYYEDSDDENNSDHDLDHTISHSSTCSSLDFNTVASEDSTRDTRKDEHVPIQQSNFISLNQSARVEKNSKPALRKSTSGVRGRRSVRQKGKNNDAAALAQRRHRLRRYELFSDLLLSAAELLLLDKSQAKAFLPMLDCLLMPNSSKKAVAKVARRETVRNENTQQSRRRTPPRKSHSMPISPGREGMEDSVSELHLSSHVSVSSIEQSDISKSDFLPPSSVVTESTVHSGHSILDVEDDTRDPRTADVDSDNSLRPFLESLSPGSGFRCLCLLLLQHLLHSTMGYDARVRHVIKKLGVIVLVHEMKRDACDFMPSDFDYGTVPVSDDEFVAVATRKFESLEHVIAWKLLHLSSERRSKGRRASNAGSKKGEQDSARKKGVSREQLVRGLKIGSAGIVAGTLFAVTGGLAAPGIAAGVAAVAGSSAATAAVVTLTSSAAITAIFGVGGGGLAAYKMQRRTQGLTEFEFQKESGSVRDGDGHRVKTKVEPELFSTICLSGWLRDECDFQRPWGVTPTNPRIKDLQELLERFYAVHKPEYIQRSSTILSRWKGQERELWHYLRETYGSDPSHLFPLDEGPRQRGALTHEQTEIVDKLLCELGFSTKDSDGGETHSQDNTKDSATTDGDEILPGENSKVGWRHRIRRRSQQRQTSSSRQPETPENSGMGSRRLRTPLTDSFRRSRTDRGSSTPDCVSHASSGVESSSSTSSTIPSKEDQSDKDSAPPKHIATVWDYQSHYGGEHYTVKWESRLLLELSDSVEDLALDMMGGATTHILRQTAFSTLLSAMALPYVLVNAANMIDGTWTLAIERSEEAGKELARSLLFSRAGYRPVVLVGFSMGARTIYTCLKELARYQEKWEELRNETGEDERDLGRKGTKKGDNKEDIFELMREPASIVEDAILMGMPNHLSLSSWAACRRIVAGRLVNCYSRKDLVLSLMFKFKRLSGGLKPVCGTCPVEVDGVENVDVSDLVSSHQDYCLVTGDILKRVRHGQPIRQQLSEVISLETNGTE